MKRFFILALVFLAACTGTKGEHDPVALIVATDIGGQHALQVVETKNLQALVGDPLVVHNGFTKAYPSGTTIVQLAVPGQRRLELWVMYTSGGNMFIDVFTPVSIDLSQPAPLTPAETIQLGPGNPHGFAVHNDLIAVRNGDDLTVFNRAGDELDYAAAITAPFNVAPVFVEAQAYFWSEGVSNTLELVHIGGLDTFAFGPLAASPPAVSSDTFDPAVLVHVGANGRITMLDPALGAEPISATAHDLGAAQAAWLVGSKVLVRTNTALEQVALTHGDTFQAQLVSRDTLSTQDVVVHDPYNQYAYPLRAGSGEIISTLGSLEAPSGSEPLPSQRVHSRVTLANLGTPIAGEAFIVTSSQ